MNTVRKALGFSFLSQYLLQVVQFVVIVILSRLLTPSEIGVFSVAAVSLFLATELRNFGVAQFIIRTENLTPERIASAKGVAIIMAESLALVFFFGANSIASFFSEPGLASIYYIVAINFLIAPFIMVPHAYLIRSMSFDRTMVVALTGNIVRGGVAVALAYLDFGYMSLAWGYLVGGITEVIVTLVLRQDPRGNPSFRGMSEIFSFGAWSTTSGIIARGYDGIADLMLARISSMDSAGIFSRAMGLILLFSRFVTKGINGVVLPYFSKQLREGACIKLGFLHAVTLQTSLAWPFFAVLYFLADSTILLLFGDQWLRAGPIVQGLCLWGALQSIYAMYGQILVAKGFIRLLFINESLFLVSRSIAILVAIPLGLNWVAVAVSVSGIVEFSVASLMLKKAADIGPFDILRTTIPSWFPTVACCLVAWFCVEYLAGTIVSSNWRMSLCIVTAFFTWLACVFLVKHPVSDEIRFLSNKVLARSSFNK